MPQLVIAPEARLGLDRCRLFLAKKNSAAAKRAATVITQRFTQLQDNPEIGRKYSEDPDLRELTIRFGDSGDVALYRFLQAENRLVIVAFRHQKEAGY